jgi:hypothetical protein
MFLEVLDKKRDKKVFAGRTEKRAVCQKNNQSLSIGIKHALPKCPVEEFRKESSFFPNPVDHKSDLTLPPINIQVQFGQGREDYWLKC